MCVAMALVMGLGGVGQPWLSWGMRRKSHECIVQNTFQRHHIRVIVSQLDCLFNSLFWLTWKKTWKPVLLVLCEGKPLVTGGFPSQRASNAESISISSHHHEWPELQCRSDKNWTGMISLPVLVTYFGHWAENSVPWAENFSRVILNSGWELVCIANFFVWINHWIFFNRINSGSGNGLVP